MNPIIRTGPITYSLDQGLKYGEMPYSLLASKFEESNMPETDFRDYAREVITDKTPDKNLLASEEPRGAVSARSGTIQLHYYGHRGVEDTPYRPEHFDNFEGGSMNEPRGINVDPDMKEFVKQEQSRMRFVRFTPDGNDQITGGGRSQYAVMQDKQRGFMETKRRLKVFSRQLDGRRTGMRREFEYKSVLGKQSTGGSYGEAITDFALNPQRRVVKMCSKLVRDTYGYRKFMLDSDLAIAQYSQIRKSVNAPANGANRKNFADSSQFGESGKTVVFKALAVRVGDLLNAKKQALKNIDVDGDSTNTQVYKTKVAMEDIAEIAKYVQFSTDFGSSDKTQIRKTNNEEVAGVARNEEGVERDYATISAIVFKTYKNGETPLNVLEAVQQSQQFGTSDESKILKQNHKNAGGASREHTHDFEFEDSGKVVDYRSAKYDTKSRKLQYNGENIHTVEDNTQNRKSKKDSAKGANREGDTSATNFGENQSKERHTAPIGSKYTQRFVDGEDIYACEV